VPFCSACGFQLPDAAQDCPQAEPRRERRQVVTNTTHGAPRVFAAGRFPGARLGALGTQPLRERDISPVMLLKLTRAQRNLSWHFAQAQSFCGVAPSPIPAALAGLARWPRFRARAPKNAWGAGRASAAMDAGPDSARAHLRDRRSRFAVASNSNLTGFASKPPSRARGSVKTLVPVSRLGCAGRRSCTLTVVHVKHSAWSRDPNSSTKAINQGLPG
jgi:hypothetical protein